MDESATLEQLLQDGYSEGMPGHLRGELWAEVVMA
jgi:hypothetical protein